MKLISDQFHPDEFYSHSEVCIYQSVLNSCFIHLCSYFIVTAVVHCALYEHRCVQLNADHALDFIVFLWNAFSSVYSCERINKKCLKFV